LGALFEAFEKLKARLQQEGLFDPARKVPLPYLPRGVGIVTSAKGAVVQDIFRVIRRRYPNMPLYLVPVKVQGDGAATEIVAGIRRLDTDPRVDVIIVGRGGGSLEDLWAFNEEPVARAIAAAVKPVISAVGHETDTTIADFVADRRAATPSQAGEFAVPVKDDLVRRIVEMYQRLKRNLEHRLEVARQRLARAQACRFLAKPELLIAERRNTIANLIRDVETWYKELVTRARHQYELLAGRLKSLSPRQLISERRNDLMKLIQSLHERYKRNLVAARHAFEMRQGRLALLNPRALLQRGYILAQDGEGRVVTSIQALACEQIVTLHLRDGRAETRVTRIEPETEEPTP
ncbi:MAG TPA: exodeoxyribonuclease VII large subunit, partial [Candidatus Ozemobacteraceae bacterium]|nr:exodeoxyribonuclease VII large subunit [Candidatus Ozemobacteraceae bacterium]